MRDEMEIAQQVDHSISITQGCLKLRIRTDPLHPSRISSQSIAGMAADRAADTSTSIPTGTQKGHRVAAHDLRNFCFSFSIFEGFSVSKGGGGILVDRGKRERNDLSNPSTDANPSIYGSVPW